MITALPAAELPQQIRPARLKVSLLCDGVRFPIDLFNSIGRPFYANQYVYGRTSRQVLRSHQVPQAFCLGDGVISAVLRREATAWSINVRAGIVELAHRSGATREIQLPEKPGYFGHLLSNGQRSDDVIAVAGECTPGFFLYPDCYYFSAGVPCGFCSLKHSRKTAGKEMASAFDPDLISEATRLFQRTPWKKIPIISITTGTFPDNDEGARYTSKMVRAIYDALDPKLPIHVLTMPPDNLELISLYREAGATSVAFNLEVFDEQLFGSICPGKLKYYGYYKFKAALVEATRVFDPFHAFCGFVWGLEPVESVVKGYRWCLERGVSISSNVFHADPGSVYSTREHPDEGYVTRLCEAQTELYGEFPGARTIFPVSMRSTLDWEIHRGDFR